MRSFAVIGLSACIITDKSEAPFAWPDAEEDTSALCMSNQSSGSVEAVLTRPVGCSDLHLYGLNATRTTRLSLHWPGLLASNLVGTCAYCEAYTGLLLPSDEVTLTFETGTDLDEHICSDVVEQAPTVARTFTASSGSLYVNLTALVDDWQVGDAAAGTMLSALDGLEFTEASTGERVTVPCLDLSATIDWPPE